MSNYTKLTDFATKDSLPTGSAAKIVKGTEIDDEFEAIESSIATKADSNSPALTGVPTAPTAAAGTNTTQVATTAYVQTELDTPDVTSVTFGSWVVSDDGSTILNIAYSGTDVFKLDSSGNLTVIGNITAYGTI